MSSFNKIRCALSSRWSSSQNHNYFQKTIRKISTDNETIVIPHRIQRKPTDILEALASTVQRDYTAPHYKYQDDPYFTPVSSVAKRSHSLSKEAGRKAAQWVQMQHPDLFQHKVADPFIQAFVPKIVHSEDSLVDEDVLKSCIYTAQVTEAITIYERLKNQGTDISDVTTQSFLELLCYYNSEDTLPEEQIEERWFWQSGTRETRVTWKDNGVAEQIFNSLKTKDSAAYNAIIRGMACYFQMQRAWQLFEETKEKNIPLSAETYNLLLKGVIFLHSSADLRWKQVNDLLVDMAEKNIPPNIGTMNAVLESLSNMKLRYHNSTGNALRVVAEFKALGIEPCLASYYFLLKIFYREREPAGNLLSEILDYIQGKEFQIQHPKDTFFFTTAMSVCRNSLQDKDLGYRVDALLHTGKNYNFLGDSYKESIYYRHFLMLVCETEPLEIFMELYNKVVPNVYTPEPRVMVDVIKMIDMNAAVELLPRIWSDIVIFNQSEREELVIEVLQCMVKNAPLDDINLSKQFEDIAWKVWNTVEGIDAASYSRLSWTGAMLGDVLVLVAKDFEKASAVMNKLYKEQNTIAGVPHVSALQKFLDVCIENANVKMALMCVQYCADALFPETQSMGEQLINALPLQVEERVRLSNIVGKNFVDKPDNVEEPENVEQLLNKP